MDALKRILTFIVAAPVIGISAYISVRLESWANEYWYGGPGRINEWLLSHPLGLILITGIVGALLVVAWFD
jgi:hypothetical protein